MTTTPVPTTSLDRFFAGLHRIPFRRSTTDKHLGGVCGGLAAHLGVSARAVRIGAIVLSILGGIGVTLYLLAWLLVPNSEGTLHLERAIRGGAGGSIVLLVVTILTLLPEPHSHVAGGWFVALAAIVGLLVVGSRRGHTSAPTPPYAGRPWNADPTAGPAQPGPWGPAGPQDAPRA